MDDVDALIADLPSDERIILQRLRTLILEADPRIREKLSYGVPYYFLNRRVCFLWPASCIPREFTPPRGNLKVTLGLCYGNMLSNDQGILLREGRKQVYVIKFNSTSDINEPVVREILQEAILADGEFRKKKKR